MLRSPANGKCAQSIILPRPQPVGRGAGDSARQIQRQAPPEARQKHCAWHRYSSPGDGYRPAVVKRITGLKAPAPDLSAIRVRSAAGKPGVIAAALHHGYGDGRKPRRAVAIGCRLAPGRCAAANIFGIIPKPAVRRSIDPADKAGKRARKSRVERPGGSPARLGAAL
jgi:hypothetical protein